ncbi:hypothetical protein DERF_012961 [Dermatophagoides farinae]|uniref:Uncharacterized protein n=1 Tax=Dermatophagoides farinae TaxID=6954 RepID=A0A922HNH9_DERFA|nr:hypothetical protein DERF_012961 [Dermatophagoides farinae]
MITSKSSEVSDSLSSVLVDPPSDNPGKCLESMIYTKLVVHLNLYVGVRWCIRILFDDDDNGGEKTKSSSPSLLELLHPKVDHFLIKIMNVGQPKYYCFG